MEKLPFQTHKELFRTHALNIMTQSPEYTGIDKLFDNLLILGDRVLIACQEHPDLDGAWDIVSRLNEIDEAMQNNKFSPKMADDLIVATERWLKPILWLADLPHWQKLQGSNDFTLSAITRELNLLTQQEIGYPHDQYHQINDPVRRLILQNYRYRNFIHDPRTYPITIQQDFLLAALVTILASLFKHYEPLQSKLTHLIVNPLGTSHLKTVLKENGDEQRNHLEHFAGRQGWLTKLRQRLEGDLRQKGKYLLLTAQEGSGKSAICAKLAELLGQEITPLGPHAETVRRVVTWLPATILYFGKQSANRPHEVARLLIEQANTLLLNPVPLPDINEQRDFIVTTESAFSSKSTTYSSHKMRQPNNQMYALETDYREEYRPKLQPNFATSPNLETYSRALYEVLDRVAQERGYVILIIDALDEISPDGSGLTFLPERLPSGVSALLTARSNDGINKWLRKYRNIEKLRLEELTRAEIPLITGIDDAMGEAERKFNDKVHHKSKGWALMVHDVAQNVQANEGDFTQVSLEGTSDTILERQANEWQSPLLTNGLDPLHEVLLLLALFEPIPPLKLNFVQYYLEHNQINLAKSEIRNLLQPIRAQITGLDSNAIKLGIKAFAEYVRDRYCSPRDLRRALEQVVKWLIDDREVEPSTLASFLQYWTDSSQVKEAKLRETANNLIQTLIDKKETELLSKIAKVSWRDKAEDSKLASRCLRAAAELGDGEAMGQLGNRLFEGEGLLKDSIEGKKWLYDAAKAGHQHSMFVLSHRLFEGDELAKDLIEAEQWLRKVVETGYAPAMNYLGNRLLQGDGLPQNNIEGEKWLRQAVETGDEYAIFVLSQRLLEGVGLEKKNTEGEKWLRQLAEAKNPNAMTNLANRLLDGDELSKDKEEGETWLRQAVSLEHLPAMYSLGLRLIDGDNITPNPIEGEKWLRQAVEKDYELAQYHLAIRLLDGNGLAQNKTEGEKLLRDLAKNEFSPAMFTLGQHLLIGNTITKDEKEGRRWLHKAAETKLTLAMRVLAERLLDGDGIPQNIKEGQQWLQKAVDAGNTTAMALLGYRLIEGMGYDKNVSMGELWLRKAIKKNNSVAMRILGHRLITGDGLKRNAVEGEAWLRQAAKLNDAVAMLFLGQHLLDGADLRRNSYEGEQWLQQAAKAKDLDAMQDLGERLLDGNGLVPNRVEGEKWLRKAAGANEKDAMLVLAIRLLDGNKLLQNNQEGEIWLDKVVKMDYLPAILELGDRLLEGNGLPQKKAEGLKWLRQASEKGYLLATTNLAYRYLFGQGVSQNQASGEKYLNQIRQVKAGDNLDICGEYFYRKETYAIATELFFLGFKLGNHDAGNDLAYMLRRGETQTQELLPNITQLLTPLLERNVSVALTNYALCLAKGFQVSENWHLADEQIAKMGNPFEVLSWWYDLVKNGDSEGDLVIGWLARHGLIDDPDGLEIVERMNRARAGGWRVPAWMDGLA